MRDLLEKMMKFAGEKVGQKPGDQWRGTDKAPPGKKLVGDSILKDLSKGKTPKSKEQELSEEFQAFLEAEFKDTVDKRPARKNARPARGHEPNPGYKTVKADEAAGKGIDYHDQIPIKSVMQGLKVDYNRKTNQTILSYRGKPIETFIYDGIPTLGHFDVAVDHKIAELMKLGKIPKMPSLPRNRSSQPQTYNLDQEYSHGIDLPKNVQQQMFQQHDQDTENYGMVSVSNPAKWANVNAKKEKEKEKQQKVAESSMSEKDIELQDYRSMSHKEFQASYGMTKTEWINQNKALVIKNPSIKKSLGINESHYKWEITFRDGKQAVYQQNNPHYNDKTAASDIAYSISLNPGSRVKATKDGEPFEWQVLLSEGWESGPEEYEEPYDDADDAYDRQRQEKIDTEAEKEWAKLPKVSTYKLIGRGPNMEPNYEFGDEFDSMEQALDYRAEIMKDPKTPHPEHIGIRTITRVVDKQQTNEAFYNTPKNKEDYDAKMTALQDLQTDPNTANDEELQRKIIIYMDNLQKVANQHGWLAQPAEESRGHKIVATKLKDIERSKKFASGELKIPTPQERQAQLKQLEKAKPVKEYGASNNVTPYGQPAADPKKAAQIAQGAQAFKAATGITAPATNIAKALDDASQGKPADRTSMKVLEPAMQDLVTIMSDPKLGSEYKSLAQKVNQKQQKPQ